jgi:pimeloyl-ACP methyl ester carboxylesterase
MGALAIARLLAVAAAATAVAAPPRPVFPGPWEEGFVDTPARDGREAMRFHYLAAGPADAPRVVLLHGFPDLAWTWRELIPLLSPDYRVLAPDMPGYGESSSPAGGYDVATLAADVLAFAEAAALADLLSPEAARAPFHLVGHDWGAAVGWRVAAFSPERLLSWTAAGVPHPATWEEFRATHSEQRRKSRYMRVLVRDSTPGLLSWYAQQKHGRLWTGNLRRKEAFPEEVRAVYAAAFSSPEDWRGPLAYYKELLAAQERGRTEPPAWPDVATLPVLQLWGAKDKYVMAEMAPLVHDHCKAPGTMFQVLENAGHFVQWEDPAAFVATWRSFLAGLP